VAADARSSRRWSIALSVVGASVLLLGIWGFARQFAAQRPPVLDLVYWAFQLFGLELREGGGPMPWQVQVARFAAPLVTGALVLEALRTVTTNVTRAFSVAKLWRFKGHVIICGIGRKALTLALAARHRDPRTPVVVVERDPSVPLLAVCRQAGVFVHVGDATDPDVLRGAGLLRARVLVALTGDDGANIQIAERARGALKRARRSPLRVLVHVVDDELARVIHELELARGPHPELEAIELSPFDIYDSGARVLLHTPPHPRRRDPAGHIVIVGVGAFGSTLAVQAAQAWVRRPGAPRSRLRITLLDHDPSRRRALEAQHPELAGSWELRQVEMDTTSGEFHTAAFLRWETAIADVIYVCFDDDARAVAAALSLQPRAHADGIPIVVRRSEETGLASLLDPQRGLYDFPLVERTCTPDILEQTLTERMARALHDHQELVARPEDAALPWERLAEEQRHAYRDRARHLPARLRRAGYRMVPYRAATDALVALPPEDVLRLAEPGGEDEARELPAVLRTVGFALERG
jgi:voltage-gated potassium channel Kch